VGNMIDLYEKQEVEKKQGEDYGKEIGAFFIETSAKEDKLGFKQFVNKLIEKSIGKKTDVNNSNNIEGNKKLNSKKGKKKRKC